MITRQYSHNQRMVLNQTWHMLGKERVRLIRWMIILSVLMMSLILPVVNSTTISLMTVGLVVGIAGSIFLIRYKPLGLVLIILLSVSVPFSGPGGFNGAILGVAFILGIWFIDMLIRERKIHFVKSSLSVPLLFFTVSALISFLFGQLPWYPLAQQAPILSQVGGLAIFILSAGAFFLVGNLVRDTRWLKIMVGVFLVLGSLYILGRNFPVLARYLRHIFQAGATTNSLFWVWLVVIPLSQAMINEHLRMGWRIALLVLVAATLCVAIVYASDWKSGYIPPLAGMAVIIALRYRRLTSLFIPAAIIGFWFISTQAVVTEEYSYSTRLDAWQIVIRIAEANPILGLGFANYYFYTPLFPIRGWSVNFNSHSQYVDIFAQTGLVGLLCFLWLFFEMGRLGWRLKERAPIGFARAYVYGALGGLVGTLVAAFLVDWVLPFVYNLGMNGFRGAVLSWLFLGGLMSIEQIVLKQEGKTQEYEERVQKESVNG